MVHLQYLCDYTDALIMLKLHLGALSLTFQHLTLGTHFCLMMDRLYSYMLYSSLLYKYKALRQAYNYCLVNDFLITFLLVLLVHI